MVGLFLSRKHAKTSIVIKIFSTFFLALGFGDDKLNLGSCRSAILFWKWRRTLFISLLNCHLSSLYAWSVCPHWTAFSPWYRWSHVCHKLIGKHSTSCKSIPVFDRRYAKASLAPSAAPRAFFSLVGFFFVFAAAKFWTFTRFNVLRNWLSSATHSLWNSCLSLAPRSSVPRRSFSSLTHEVRGDVECFA